MTYAIIPAKSFSGAKQRLSTFLQPHERRLLARAMLTDTLTACSQATGLAGMGVVTCDREVAEVAGACGAEVLWEAQAQGHSQAVAFGVQACRQRGSPTMLTLPGDLPLLSAADVQAIIAPPEPPGAGGAGAQPGRPGDERHCPVTPGLPSPWPLATTASSGICGWRLSATWESRSAVSHGSHWTSTNQVIWRCLQPSRCRAIVFRCWRRLVSWRALSRLFPFRRMSVCSRCGVPCCTVRHSRQLAQRA